MSEIRRFSVQAAAVRLRKKKIKNVLYVLLTEKERHADTCRRLVCYGKIRIFKIRTAVFAVLIKRKEPAVNFKPKRN